MIWNQLFPTSNNNKNDYLKLKCYKLKEVCLIFLLRTLDWIKISKFNQSWFETGNFIDLERVEDKLQRFQPEGSANCGWASFNAYQKVKILQVIWYSQDIPDSLDHPQKEKIWYNSHIWNSSATLWQKFNFIFIPFPP